MNANLISALSALADAVIGGVMSLLASWVANQRPSASARRIVTGLRLSAHDTALAHRQSINRLTTCSPAGPPRGSAESVEFFPFHGESEEIRPHTGRIPPSQGGFPLPVFARGTSQEIGV